MKAITPIATAKTYMMTKIFNKGLDFQVTLLVENLTFFMED